MKILMRLETPCFTFINGPMNDISSSEIRRRNKLSKKLINQIISNLDDNKALRYKFAVIKG